MKEGVCDREESPVKCSRKLNVKGGWRESSSTRVEYRGFIIIWCHLEKSVRATWECGWQRFCYVKVTLLDEWMVVGAKLNDVICGGFNFLVEQLLTMHEREPNRMRVGEWSTRKARRKW